MLDREVLGYGGVLSKTKIKQLRKDTAAFIAGDFRNIIEHTLYEMGATPDLFQINLVEGGNSDRDPQILILNYKAITNPINNYLPDSVKIEIGCRSLMEPASSRQVQSIMGETLPDLPFSGKPFTVLAVDPTRTMLEKMFLLHEEFNKVPEKIRHDRMSRHLYDLSRLMETAHCDKAVTDAKLYKFIIKHREKYTPVNGLDYKGHLPQTINFIPPADVVAVWERDYAQMQEMMIYGDAPKYPELIKRMERLMGMIRQLTVE